MITTIFMKSFLGTKYRMLSQVRDLNVIGDQIKGVLSPPKDNPLFGEVWIVQIAMVNEVDVRVCETTRGAHNRVSGLNRLHCQLLLPKKKWRNEQTSYAFWRRPWWHMTNTGQDSAEPLLVSKFSHKDPLSATLYCKSERRRLFCCILWSRHLI